MDSISQEKKTVNMAWEAINCYMCFVAQVHQRAKKQKHGIMGMYFSAKVYLYHTI